MAISPHVMSTPSDLQTRLKWSNETSIPFLTGCFDERVVIGGAMYLKGRFPTVVNGAR